MQKKPHAKAAKTAKRNTENAIQLVHSPFACNASNSAEFWSAPAERSGDGALAFLRKTMGTPVSCSPRAQHPKRRGASLPAALQNAGASATVARPSAR